MPPAAARSRTVASRAAPSIPASLKPAEMMIAARTPARAQSSMTPGTKRAGTATTARSMASPMSLTRAWTGRPASRRPTGFTGYTAPRKPLSRMLSSTRRPTLRRSREAPITATERGENRKGKSSRVVGHQRRAPPGGHGRSGTGRVSTPGGWSRRARWGIALAPCATVPSPTASGRPWTPVVKWLILVNVALHLLGRFNLGRSGGRVLRAGHRPGLRRAHALAVAYLPVPACRRLAPLVQYVRPVDVRHRGRGVPGARRVSRLLPAHRGGGRALPVGGGRSAE